MKEPRLIYMSVFNRYICSVDDYENESQRPMIKYFEEKPVLWIENSAYDALKQERDALKAEVARLIKVIAKELTENDELGCEYAYVNSLREENAALQAKLEIAVEALDRIKLDSKCWLDRPNRDDLFDISKEALTKIMGE